VLTPQGGQVEPGAQGAGRLLLPISWRYPEHEAHRAAISDGPAKSPGRTTGAHAVGSFLFRGDDVFKPVAVLSGGEKSRLALVRLLLEPPNFLLMDEPTTHLDMGSIDALVGALEDYEGTLVFISHDVHFIRSMARSVGHVSGGALTRYAGDYQYYLDKTKATSARAALTAGSG
jgi:ATP-binding cassette, subfamily F, member 3